MAYVFFFFLKPNSLAGRPALYWVSTNSWRMVCYYVLLMCYKKIMVCLPSNKMYFILYFYFVKPPVGTTLYGLEAFRAQRFLLSSPYNTIFLNLLFKKQNLPSHLSPFPSQSDTELPLSPWQPRGEPKPMHGPRPSGLRKPFQVISLSLSLLAECYVTPGRNCGQIDKRVKIKRS